MRPTAYAGLIFFGGAATVFATILAACRFTDGLTGGPFEDGGVPIECDADLQASAANCGACGHGCPNGPNGIGTCVDGGCALACAEARGDCDQDPSNGCETSLLTDKKHCNRCRHDCFDGGCSLGVCQPVVLMTGANTPAHIVSDSVSLYGINAAGVVTHVKPDGTIAVLADAGGPAQSPPPRIAVASNVLYYTSFSVPAGAADAGPGSGSIWVHRLDGGTRTRLAANAPFAIHAAPPYLYWSEGNPEAADPTGSVHRCAPPSCPTRNSVDAGSSAINAIVADNTHSVYWVDRGTSPKRTDGAIVRHHFTANATEQLTGTSAIGPVDVALSTDLYFTATGDITHTTGGGYVGSCNINGCNLNGATRVALRQDVPRFVAVHAGTGANRFLFWTTSDGAVKTILYAGPPTAERTLYRDPNAYVWDIAADANAVYWTELAIPSARQAVLYKLARP